MPRDLILGTAVHIDHGKTSLVKALTGIDCDRLPEEKARGITIDIGFASLDLRAAPLEACHKAHGLQPVGFTDSEWFRLAIDRSFVVQGHGTVVTGSVTSGSVRVGEELEWLPGGERVRVRALHNHDRPVEE